jgi:hypothetical protein
MIKQGLSGFVDVCIPAKSGANTRVRVKQTLHFVIEAPADQVIPMKDMNEMSSRALQASLEIEKAPNIFMLAEIGNSASSHFLNDCQYIGVCAAIIYHLNLHTGFSLVLLKYACQCLPQITGTVVNRYHYRP